MPALERRLLGRTGFGVTFIGFGALEIGRDWGLGDEVQRRRPDEAAAAQVLNGVLDLGVNLIDTARAYHLSEERVGRAISHRRSEFILASKCGEHSADPGTYYDFSYEAVKASIDMSLRLLQTDRIDIMQIHFGPDPERVLAEGETLRAMREAQGEGKVRFLGASPPTHLIGPCIERGVFDVLQVEYSLLNPVAGRLIEEAARRGIGVLVRGGLAMGRLTGKARALAAADTGLQRRLAPFLDLVDGDWDRLPEVALAFLYTSPGVSCVLVGSKSLDHVRAAVEIAGRGFAPEFLEAVREAVGRVAA